MLIYAPIYGVIARGDATQTMFSLSFARARLRSGAMRAPKDDIMPRKILRHAAAMMIRRYMFDAR